MGVRVRQKNGEWWVFINHDGKRKSKRIGPDEDLANDVAAGIRRKIGLGEFNMGKKKPVAPTFKLLAELWLTLPHDQKDSTLDSYRHYLAKHIYPALGGKRVDEIKRRDLKVFLDRLLTNGLAPASVHTARAILSNVLNYAVDLETIETNPMRDIKGGRQHKKNDLPIEPLTEEEADLLLTASKSYLGGAYYPATLTLLRTGMRIGELEALQWGDIDFNGRFIEVRRSVRYGRVTDTKNRLRRRVDMTPALADTLQALRVRQIKAALKAGRPEPEWVFEGKRDERLNRSTYRLALRQCLKLAKLRQVRIHDLRHTYATVRLLRGHNIGDVSYQLGHSSIQITYDTYGHWLPGRFKRETDDLDRVHPTAPQAHPRDSSIIKS